MPWGTPSNKGKQTKRSGTFKTCRTCRGTGRARGMGATGAKCGRCSGTGLVKS